MSRLTAAVLGLGAAVSVYGCHAYDCREWSQCGMPPEEGTSADTCVADPAAGRAEDRCGVFVSSSLGSDDNPGTREQPVQSIAKAIAVAQAGSMRVYACAEPFAESVMLPSGVELWGGLDCGNGWVYLGGDKRTTVAPGADLIPVRVQGGTGTSILADVRAEAADATEPSSSAISVMVMPGAAVEILRSELIAGDGAPGAPGEDGGAVPAQSGAVGESGDAACSEVTVSGGPATVGACGDFESIGGPGGNGGVTAGTDGGDGQPEPVSNPQGWGLGGQGETNGSQCQIGEEGIDGASGEEGKGATGPGRISLGGWEGDNGSDGVDGLPGQGGGGGGGRRGGAALCGSNLVRGGAGGGSGGAGGCGGKRGMGGGFGGASIGLLSLGSQVALRSSTIRTGDGGDGGPGGLAQAGGVGGSAGPGGAGFQFAFAGCDGGKGGHGGNGGSGGGGLGGPSIGIAHQVGAPVTQEGLTIEIGKPGQGGLGGNPAVPGSTGAEGLAGVVMPFPQ